MRTKSILTAVAVLSLAVVSCVKTEYDNKNSNNEINVLPGVSVKVDKNLSDITPNTLFEVDGKTVSVDAEGNYKIVGTSKNGGIQEDIPSETFDAGDVVALNGEVEGGQ